MTDKLERCPDGCWRPKARNADDCMAGCCSKWYAIRDPEARAECEKLAAFWSPPKPQDVAVNPDHAGILPLPDLTGSWRRESDRIGRSNTNYALALAWCAKELERALLIAPTVAWRSKMPNDSRWLLTDHEPSVPGIIKRPLIDAGTMHIMATVQESAGWLHECVRCGYCGDGSEDGLCPQEN